MASVPAFANLSEKTLQSLKQEGLIMILSGLIPLYDVSCTIQSEIHARTEGAGLVVFCLVLPIQFQISCRARPA